MTWSQFFQSMRTGISQRASTIVNRAGGQQPAAVTTGKRQVSTQAQTKTSSKAAATTTKAGGSKQKGVPTMDKYDWLVLDVRFLLK